MNEMGELYKTALLRLGVAESGRNFLEQIGYSLVGQKDAFRRLQLVILKKESLYRYSSLLGTSVVMEFDWDSSTACLTYLESEVRLSMKDFMLWLSYTDLLLAPVFPLGSVVELDRELLPEDLVEEMDAAKVPFMATIMGRRLLSEPSDGKYLDYLASIYPYGLRLDVDPLFIPSYLISRVIQEGYSDMLDQHYINQQYRRDYFQHNIISLIYSIEGEE